MFLPFPSSAFYIQNNYANIVGSTYIKQNTPSLCTGTLYKLTYSSKIDIVDGRPGDMTCWVRISLAEQQLVYIGPPDGDALPYTYETRETTFTYSGTRTGNILTVEFSCSASQGSYTIANVSIVGV